MGIRLLQTFLSSLHDGSIQEKHLREFSNKKISIDISIYLYRFKEMGSILENVYLMCSIFRHYNISPLFVFDGKSLKIKNDTINKRKQLKKIAKKEFNALQTKLKKSNGHTRKQIETKMNDLQKKFITITKNDVIAVKNLLDAYGMSHVTAKREADELCGAFNNETIYACMTEDTDIMAYGCEKILRYFSLMKHTVVVYNMDIIRNNLSMTLSEFQELCVCAGNDYITSQRNIFYYYDLFKEYNRSSQNGFMDWLLEKRLLSLQEYHQRKEIYDMYNFIGYDPFEDVPYTIIKNKHVNKENLIEILETIGFVFPN